MVLISDLVQCGLFIHFKQPLGTLEIMPFPEKKSAKKQNEDKSLKKIHKASFIKCSVALLMISCILSLQVKHIPSPIF